MKVYKPFKIGFQRSILFYFQTSNQSHQIHINRIMNGPPGNVTYLVHINSATSSSTTEVTLQSCSAASCLLSKPSTSLITIFLTIAITYMCNNWLLHASELWQLYSLRLSLLSSNLVHRYLKPFNCILLTVIIQFSKKISTCKFP